MDGGGHILFGHHAICAAVASKHLGDFSCIGVGLSRMILPNDQEGDSYHEGRQEEARRGPNGTVPVSTITIRQPKPNRWLLAQQQHIWLGQRYFARWIHVAPT